MVVNVVAHLLVKKKAKIKSGAISQ